MKLATTVFGHEFQNPILLAAGTCGFGQELEEVLDVEELGGFVTKSVTVEPRSGNPAPRVTEFGAGMLNSVGLANPGLIRTRSEKLPWLASHVRRARVFVSVAGHTVEEFFQLLEGLDGADGFLGFELNLSCPNDNNRGGPPFALDPEAVSVIVSGCRARTQRPLLAKLAPNDPDVGSTARLATEAGVDGITLVNTLPGLLLRAGSGETELGAGQGGMSGPGLRPAGLRAVREARAHTDVPLLGVGGVLAPQDAVAYARAGANLVQMGTASFAAPRASAAVIRGLKRWGARQGVASWDDLQPSRGVAI
ncbi:MAG: dihydroorotate dehydrogenase [Gemmatimonadetes bacterium]|nr:dihydroorotate dehydrogenase [Gemmatimonadota bacterium]MDA1103036.1 dihydroorotate dehydrogenase [Gemmatimonadota bacterium]